MQLRFIFALVSFALLSVAAAIEGILAYTPLDVVVKDLKLFVEGREFIVKGMAYNPVPLGWDSQGGFCSIKLTAFQEYKSACFGSDFFDGTTAEATRSPPGPRDNLSRLVPWWQSTWTRDLPRIAKMGVNTIRIYNMNPLTQHYLSGRGKAEFPTAKAEYGAQHKLFLDYVDSLGLKVIFPLVSDESMLKSMTPDQLDGIIEDIIDELGNHPAILMFQIGNELPLTTDSELRDNVIQRMVKAKAYLTQKWNRILPISTATVDDPNSYVTLVEAFKGVLDVFISNAGYRYLDFQPLWDGSGAPIFPGWTKISQQYNLPLLIGEFGMIDQANATQQYPDWPNQQWSQILANVKNGCIGGVFFEYSDEPQKADTLQRDMGVVSFQVAHDAVTGKSSTDANAWLLDTIQEKPIFQTLAQGNSNSKFSSYNYKADPFALVGRSAQTISGFPPRKDKPSAPLIAGGDAAAKAVPFMALLVFILMIIL